MDAQREQEQGGTVASLPDAQTESERLKMEDELCKHGSSLLGEESSVRWI